MKWRKKGRKKAKTNLKEKEKRRKRKEKQNLFKPFPATFVMFKDIQDQKYLPSYYGKSQDFIPLEIKNGLCKPKNHLKGLPFVGFS